MVHFIGGFDARGQPLPISPARLRESAARWRLTKETPPGIAGLLKTSRDLFVHGYFVYEFLTVGVLLSLQAVESSLRLVLDSRKPLASLIDRAHAVGLIDEEAKERLHAGRELRNLFSHPEQQSVWSFGMASSLIAGSHELVSELFPEAAKNLA